MGTDLKLEPKTCVLLHGFCTFSLPALQSVFSSTPLKKLLMLGQWREVTRPKMAPKNTLWKQHGIQRRGYSSHKHGINQPVHLLEKRRICWGWKKVYERYSLQWKDMSALKRQTIQIQIPMLPRFTSDATTLNTLLNLSAPHFMHQENFALILPAHIGPYYVPALRQALRSHGWVRRCSSPQGAQNLWNTQGEIMWEYAWKHFAGNLACCRALLYFIFLSCLFSQFSMEMEKYKDFPRI